MECSEERSGQRERAIKGSLEHIQGVERRRMLIAIDQMDSRSAAGNCSKRVLG